MVAAAALQLALCDFELRMVPEVHRMRSTIMDRGLAVRPS